MTTKTKAVKTTKPTTTLAAAKGSATKVKATTKVKSTARVSKPTTPSANYMKGSVRFSLEDKKDELTSYARLVSLAADAMHLPRLDVPVEVNHTFGLLYDYQFSNSFAGRPECVWLVTNPLEKDPKKFKFMKETLHDESSLATFSDSGNDELLKRLRATL